MKSVGPVLVVVGVILALWYAAAVLMNAQWERDQAARAGAEIGWAEIVPRTLAQERPVLPAPHQVAAELWTLTWGEEVNGRKGIMRSGSLSNRGLVLHAWVTFSATMLGFVIGSGFGILLAVGIVHNRAMDRSVMPWAIASQTIQLWATLIVAALLAACMVGVIGVLQRATLRRMGFAQ